MIDGSTDLRQKRPKAETAKMAFVLERMCPHGPEKTGVQFSDYSTVRPMGSTDYQYEVLHHRRLGKRMQRLARLSGSDANTDGGGDGASMRRGS